MDKKHLSLNEKLAGESNRLARRFDAKDYSRIENIDSLLLKKDISVEKKKCILVKKLHESIVKAFSINKEKFDRKTFELLKKRLYSTRRIIIKLRSINYHLETIFLEDLKLSKISAGAKPGSGRQDALARNELEALEYAAYKLIEKAVMLDKRLLSQYAKKERKMVVEEKSEFRDLGLIFRKESEVLEHLEAKLPPPNAASAGLIKEPNFTHWVARVFSLLSYMDHLYAGESIIFSMLKKNKLVKMKISRKIVHLVKEKSRLIRIMEQKLTPTREFKLNNNIRGELHKLTVTINL